MIEEELSLLENQGVIVVVPSWLEQLRRVLSSQFKYLKRRLDGGNSSIIIIEKIMEFG